jgi:hypothetical protein
MKKLPVYLMIAILACSCSNSNTKVAGRYENMVTLRADTLNTVKLSDSLVIHEYTCRGCAYEESTHFSISDSTGIIQLIKIVTTDNNPSDIDGGSINKDLVLVPVKTGITTIKLYKFINERPTVNDSTLFTSYTIEVRNQ